MRKVLIVELGYEFDSIRECAEFLQCSYRSVVRVLRNERPTINGYRIEYVGDGHKVLETISGEVYDSAQQAIKALQLDPSTAYKVLRGERFEHKSHPIRYLK